VHGFGEHRLDRRHDGEVHTRIVTVRRPDRAGIALAANAVTRANGSVTSGSGRFAA
jgi:hypothetical protein